MRALQVTDDRRLEPGELPDPEPGPGEVTVDVAPIGRAQELFEELRRPGTDQLKVLLQP